MPSKTLTQRVDELAEKVERYLSVTDYRLDELKRDVVTIKEHFRRLEESVLQFTELKERVARLDDLLTQAARHDERLKSLEKGHDRLWQFAPMVISAVGVVIALVALFVKK